MNIASLKLVTGEEIVADLQQTLNPSVYTLRRPHTLMLQPDRMGQLGLAFVPWTLSNTDIDAVEIPVNSVVAIFKPSDAVEKEYIQKTTRISLK